MASCPFLDDVFNTLRQVIILTHLKFFNDKDRTSCQIKCILT